MDHRSAASVVEVAKVRHPGSTHRRMRSHGFCDLANFPCCHTNFFARIQAQGKRKPDRIAASKVSRMQARLSFVPLARMI